VFTLLLCTLSLRLSEGRQQSGIISLQRTLSFIPVLVLTSLVGPGVSKAGFNIDGSFLGKRRA
jgi:branched-subunit amino acid transport protein